MSYFIPLYEIRLAGRDIQIDMACWDNIRDHARNNKWFYVSYKGELYRYIKSQEYFDRPTRFDFEKKLDNWNDTPDIICIYPKE